MVKIRRIGIEEWDTQCYYDVDTLEPIEDINAVLSGWIFVRSDDDSSGQKIMTFQRPDEKPSEATSVQSGQDSNAS